GSRAALIPTALARLSRLDNIDKHRVIHAVWAGVQFNLFDPFPGMPADFEKRMGAIPGEALENDAEIGEVWFVTPLPHQWEPSQRERKSYFRVQVALDQPPPFRGVLEVVPFCLGGVEAVLRLLSRSSHTVQRPFR